MNDLLHTIRQELNELIALRRRVVKENNPIDRLFKKPSLSWEGLYIEEARVQSLTPGFYVQYSIEDDSYVLLPKVDKEVTTNPESE